MADYEIEKVSHYKSNAKSLEAIVIRDEDRMDSQVFPFIQPLFVKLVQVVQYDKSNGAFEYMEPPLFGAHVA